MERKKALRLLASCLKPLLQTKGSLHPFRPLYSPRGFLGLIHKEDEGSRMEVIAHFFACQSALARQVLVVVFDC